MLKVRREKNFPKKFFLNFLFRMTQFAKKKQKRNVGDFALFDPWRENQSFFGHAVFAKCYITLRRFYLQHFSKNVRAVFSKKPKNPIFDPFLPQKRGSNYFFGKSGSVTFFHLCSPNFMQKIRKIVRANSEKSALLTDVRTN